MSASGEVNTAEGVNQPHHLRMPVHVRILPPIFD